MDTKYLRSVMLLITSVIVAASLASCGGGGGGSGSPASTSISFNSTLSGTSEVPSNMSAATGSGSVVIDTVTKALTATVTTTGIVGTVAHIHQGAVGVSGPIIFPLTQMPAGSGKWSTGVTLTDAQLVTLNAGGYYFNVHSAAFPAGEIRGQILPASAPAPSMGGGGGGY